MSIDRVREYLKPFGLDGRILEFETSSATVELAAQALNTAPGRIAKTLSFLNGERTLLVVAAGDARVDSSKFKKAFGLKKARMVPSEEVEPRIGHAVGGVCPFGVPDSVKTYLDVSLQRFTTVFPAAGSSNSAIELTCDELFSLSRAVEWVDVCTLPEPAEVE